MTTIYGYIANTIDWDGEYEKAVLRRDYGLSQQEIRRLLCTYNDRQWYNRRKPGNLAVLTFPEYARIWLDAGKRPWGGWQLHQIDKSLGDVIGNVEIEPRGAASGRRRTTKGG